MRRAARLLAVAAVLALAGCAVEPQPSTPPPPVGIPSAAPVPPPIMSGFGDWHGAGGVRRAWQHAGVDIRTPVGTPVLAAADGEVLRAGVLPDAGKMVVVAHAGDLATVYMHLAEIAVRAGQTVRRGEPLGRSGMTGNATTPHLHFAVCRRTGGQCGARIDAGWDDPLRYLVDGNPCYAPGHGYAAEPVRLTFPLPCTEGSG